MLTLKKLARCLFILASCAVTITAQAQRYVYYFNSKGLKTAYADSALYTRIIERPDSAANLLYSVKEYYRDKTPKLEGYCRTLDPISYEGTLTTYYPNGEKRSVAEFKNGRMCNDQYLYYRNGSLYELMRWEENPKSDFADEPLLITYVDTLGNTVISNGKGYFKETRPFSSAVDIFNDPAFGRRPHYITEEGQLNNGRHEGDWKAFIDTNSISLSEHYQDGHLKSGTAKFRDGSTSNYTKRQVQAEYKGGMQQFYNYLRNNIRYSANARRKGVQGRVIAQFVIEKDGKVSTVKVVRAPSEELAAEAIRVLQESPEWIPGTQYGVPVRVQYTVPINFALKP